MTVSADTNTDLLWQLVTGLLAGCELLDIGK